MAHKEQRNFLDKTKLKFPSAFTNCKVLDIGSFDVNGNEKPWFDDCDFIGLDLLPGPGVDVACPANEYDAPNESFDTIISCECWEHNPFYKESIINSIRMLKSGGYFIWSCATTGRPVHGTASQDLIDKSKGKTAQGNKITKWKTMPNVEKVDWDNEYYKNVTEKDIRSFCDIDSIFSSYEFEVEQNHCDLMFWGIKK
jgi:SAM-dependent methyltransferase|tara:strand:- start:6788 stop:7381 length:594 start_codon:yes stop_codon:yes gene_type:complete